MRYLYPQEINKLLKIKKTFLEKADFQQQNHSHEWEQIFIIYPPALLNARAYKVCFGCGEMVETPRTLKMDKDIQKIISEKSNSVNSKDK